jgi:enoyl-CoA hydratase
MAYETLLVEKSGATAIVTLNRPAKLNAMNSQMLDEFTQLFAELREDVNTRFVIFTGAGRAFTAGTDLTESASLNAAEAARVTGRLGQLRGQEFIRNLENLEQIAIAAVNGYCLGAGLVLAMGCDFRIASPDARFGIPEAGVGLFFTWACTPRLVSLIGPTKAKEMIMTSDMLNAEEAFRIGFVSKVVPAQELMEAAHKLVSRIGSRAPLAIRLTKKIVNAAAAPNFGDLYLCEPELVERVLLSPDLIEGVTAFMEKREPKFKEA